LRVADRTLSAFGKGVENLPPNAARVILFLGLNRSA
jgi:hypothetical protein